ncbi:unnamed protein product, partial [Soboliphyme baturini]|uniref:Rab-GAP TBC domain-containing protein n=1 Tax=Soboliphyme baturini TaxID=241478 RepID=A0A183J726_9BILA
MAPEMKRFGIDREHATFLSLRRLIIQTFGIEQDFIVSYLMPHYFGASHRYLPILSEWDFRNAIYGASDPVLKLKVDVKHVDPEFQEWDFVDTDDLLGNGIKPCSAVVPERKPSQRFQLLSMLPKGGDGHKKWLVSVPPNFVHNRSFSKSDYSMYFDAEGRLLRPELFRLRVYQTGCDNAVRGDVWPLLFELYPTGLSAVERAVCRKRMSDKYHALVDAWHRYLRCTFLISDNLKSVLSAVRKDVVRTDRNHPFYAGDEDNNPNLMMLFNAITTYALCHPEVDSVPNDARQKRHDVTDYYFQVNYCQGMSDIASLLLFVLRDEALLYACFCAIMQRLKKNFQYDGRAMTKKFQDLSELIQHYDSEFYEYLREIHADDLLFCYRWLLLEMKREFSLEEAASLMEVNLASVPLTFPNKELELFVEDTKFDDNRTGTEKADPLAKRMFGDTLNFDSFNRAYCHVDSDMSDSSDSSDKFPVCRKRYRPDSISSCQSCPSYLSEITLCSSATYRHMPQKGHTADSPSCMPEKHSSLPTETYMFHCEKFSVDSDEVLDNAFSSGITVPIYIKPSCELPVVDSPQNIESKLEQDAEVNGVPVALDACTADVAISCSNVDELTLFDIEGICNI